MSRSGARRRAGAGRKPAVVVPPVASPSRDVKGKAASVGLGLITGFTAIGFVMGWDGVPAMLALTLVVLLTGFLTVVVWQDVSAKHSNRVGVIAGGVVFAGCFTLIFLALEWLRPVVAP